MVVHYKGKMYTHKTLFRRRIVYTSIIEGNADDRRAYYITGIPPNAESHAQKLKDIKEVSIGNVGKVEVKSWENDY